MRTITFYSYKGGVGRTLALANIARYLAKFGQNVFTLDLDLEAPGLHYKFDSRWNTETGHLGVVDYLHALLSKREAPRPIRDHVIEVEPGANARGKIFLMPAGQIPSSRYWRMLTELNWHEHFYEPGARGVLSFLELKERIREEFTPDYLLIDARTGITETGGVATTLLPDLLVCLLVNNPENLEGSRMVLRGVQRTPRMAGLAPVEILPVVTRLPQTVTPDEEAHLLKSVRAFLNAPAEALEDTIAAREVFVLHSEPALEIRESLLVGATGTLGNSPLLRDYLRLFGRIIPPEVAENYTGPLIEDAFRRASEDPDGVERELEALTEAYPHPESYLRLLKFYRLRRSGVTKRFVAAKRYWELSGRADEALLREVVSSIVATPAELSSSVDFIRAVWSSREKVDSGVGIWLAKTYTRISQPETAYSIIRTLLDGSEATPEALVSSVQMLQELKRPTEALVAIEKHKTLLAGNDTFQVFWARLVVDDADPDSARSLLQDPAFRSSAVFDQDLDTWLSLQERTGMGDEAWQTLRLQLPATFKEGRMARIRRVVSLYEKHGRMAELYSQASSILGSKEAERLFERSGQREVSFSRFKTG